MFVQRTRSRSQFIPAHISKSNHNVGWCEQSTWWMLDVSIKACVSKLTYQSIWTHFHISNEQCSSSFCYCGNRSPVYPRALNILQKMHKIKVKGLIWCSGRCVYLCVVMHDRWGYEKTPPSQSPQAKWSLPAAMKIQGCKMDATCSPCSCCQLVLVYVEENWMPL